MFKLILITLIITLSAPITYSRIHQLVLKNELRHYFGVSTFGFFKGGTMKVSVLNITYTAGSTSNKLFGFSLARTASNSVTPYLESHQETCLLLENFSGSEDENVNIVSFVVDPQKTKLLVNCSNNFNLTVHPLNEENHQMATLMVRPRRSINEMTSDTFLMLRKRRNAAKDEAATGIAAPISGEQAPTQASIMDKKTDVQPSKISSPKAPTSCSSDNIPVNFTKVGNNYYYSFKFEIEVEEEHQEGLYSLYFHNCANYDPSDLRAVNISVYITEKNENSFLSAGEIPLPRLFFCMSLIFFITGCCWIYFLRKKREDSYKIHYLMGLLVFVKSLSLLFHGINYYFIAEYGYHIEAWAVMYYITHLLKGALLFITIVLIGTGWAFIKHILSDKDKKIFMIVIPLQVLANVAEIIMEESEEGETQHNTWREVFIMVDLLCCGAILFPVVWSIRHLQDASQTDGKAAVNLEKLKLFRHFYVMIVCYIYFTRIIVFLLKITVPFQYEWLDEFFREVATLLFFIITGYKFRPTQNNPYFRLPQEDTVEMEEVMTQPGLMENVYKTRRQREHVDSQEGVKRESSHEYD